MRILFVGPGNIHLVNWMAEFSKLGIDVALATFHPPALPVRHPVYRLSARSKIGYLFNRRPLLNVVEKYRPDWICAYYATSYGFLTSTISRPYIMVTAGSDVHLGLGKRLRLWPFAKRALTRASLVVCWSRSMRDAVLGFGVDPDRVIVRPRGIPLQEFLRPRNTGDLLRVICTRRFSRIFHQDVLLDAASVLRNAGLQFELLFCGEGPTRNETEARCRQMGLTDCVRFLGAVSNHDVADLLLSSTIYVSLAETDGASASLFEAMAAGCYPVVSDIPSNRDWISSANGTLVPFRDANAVALALLDAARSPDQMRKVTAANRRFAEEQLDISKNTQLLVHALSAGMDASATSGTPAKCEGRL